MNGTFPSAAFGARAGASLWETLDQLRASFDPRANAPRMARGDVRTAVLSLLAEKPMHGYQIIHEIEERSGGTWKPSAGSVYPTLQLLSDEGLISAEEEGGRKTYSLTDEGREAADAEKPAPWESQAPRDGGHQARLGALPKAGVDLAGAAAQVAKTGTPEQVEKAVAVLDDARRKLYSILADA
ncbi:PadR family transcriptional regulator [Microbacterium sp.]|uniref:PadR family transcriptional regulator n=1 Tax=Microbacterium sp. TaxID=51671 RepID=UPI00333F593B